MPTPTPQPASPTAPAPMPMNNGPVGPQPMGAPMGQPVQPVNPQPPMGGPVPMNNNVPPMGPPANNMQKQQGGSNSGLLIGGGLLLVIIALVVVFVIKPFGKSYTCTMSETESNLKLEMKIKISKSGKTVKSDEEVVFSYADGTKISETEKNAMEESFKTTLSGKAKNVEVKLKDGKVIVTGEESEESDKELDDYKKDFEKEGFICK